MKIIFDFILNDASLFGVGREAVRAFIREVIALTEGLVLSTALLGAGIYTSIDWLQWISLGITMLSLFGFQLHFPVNIRFTGRYGRVWTTSYVIVLNVLFFILGLLVQDGIAAFIRTALKLATHTA